MSQALAKKNLRHASLRPHEVARTVLLRMAADQERAAASGASWRTSRTAGRTGSIAYANAVKLARIFEADAQWLPAASIGCMPNEQVNIRFPEHELQLLDALVAALKREHSGGKSRPDAIRHAIREVSDGGQTQLDRLETKLDEALGILRGLSAEAGQEPPGELGRIAGGSPPKLPRRVQDSCSSLEFSCR